MTLTLSKNATPPSTVKGDMLKELGRYEEALQAYNKAIELDKMCGLFWANKGELLFNGESREQFKRNIQSVCT